MKITFDSLENHYLTAADLSETGRKIKSFERLEKGWHFGEGVPPERALIDKATELENLAQDLGFARTDAFPGPNGEVRYCLYNDESYYEFTLEIDGAVTTVIENQGVESETVSTFEEARNVLKKLSVWNISDLFIGDIGTSKRRISKAWHFKTPARAAEPSRLWIESVPKEMDGIFAPGSTDFTQNTRHVLRFGFSMTHYYQTQQSSPTNQAILETSVIETCAA